jgi:signal transduction histidine kinase
MATSAASKENKTSMLEKISGNTKEVIDKMSDIVWMMNPKYDDGENLREKLEQAIARIKDVAPFHVQLEIDAAIDAIKFPMEIRKTIFLIFKEAINNALKYAAATKLFVTLRLIEKNAELKIADNGKGFNIKTIDTGNGLNTMALRTKNCKGIFTIDSEENKGTTITAIIPIPHFR